MKRVLITGANKGIGLATVKKLLESYSETYVLLGSRDFKKGEQAGKTCLQVFPQKGGGGGGEARGAPSRLTF